MHVKCLCNQPSCFLGHLLVHASVLPPNNHKMQDDQQQTSLHVHPIPHPPSPLSGQAITFPVIVSNPCFNKTRIKSLHDNSTCINMVKLTYQSEVNLTIQLYTEVTCRTINQITLNLKTYPNNNNYNISLKFLLSVITSLYQSFYQGTN